LGQESLFHRLSVLIEDKSFQPLNAFGYFRFGGAHRQAQMALTQLSEFGARQCHDARFLDQANGESHGVGTVSAEVGKHVKTTPRSYTTDLGKRLDTPVEMVQFGGKMVADGGEV